MKMEGRRQFSHTPKERGEKSWRYSVGGKEMGANVSGRVMGKFSGIIGLKSRRR